MKTFAGKARIIVAMVSMLLLGASQALGHHAFSAEFDAKLPVTVSGRVTKIEWINPHAWIHLSSESEDGKVTLWMFEGGTPNTLARAGLTKHSLPVGTQVVIRGYQSKDQQCLPACKANGRDVAFADGRKVFVGSTGTGAPDDGYNVREG